MSDDLIRPEASKPGPRQRIAETQPALGYSPPYFWLVFNWENRIIEEHDATLGDPVPPGLTRKVY
jgi:hypothetical protein